MADSVHERIIDAAVTAITALNLQTTAGTAASVEKRFAITREWAATVSVPCVLVSPSGVEAILESDRNRSYKTGYPLTIRLVYTLAQERPEYLPLLLKWRKLIRNQFRDQRVIAGDAEVYTASQESGPVVEAGALEYDLISIPLSFSVEALENRPDPIP